jgi:hypothetical protein
VSFFLTPTMGAATDRLIGYSWPAFWLAVPLLVAGTRDVSRTVVFGVLACSWMVCWLPVLCQAIWPDPKIYLLVTVALALPVHYFCYRVFFRKWDGIPGHVERA